MAAVALSTFALVFAAGLPDKTAVACCRAGQGIPDALG
jgi:hypothetical protein